MGLLATATIIGSIGAAIAYQSGPSSVVSTYDFAYLAFAALWGFVFFAEVPDVISATGIVLIAAAGILAVRR
jgi:drug/metabolite transporter (DMT)-like permease